MEIVQHLAPERTVAELLAEMREAETNYFIHRGCCRARAGGFDCAKCDRLDELAMAAEDRWMAAKEASHA